MIHNDATPDIEVDPETYEVRADGELLTCEPATVLPHGAALLPVLTPLRAMPAGRVGARGSHERSWDCPAPRLTLSRMKRSRVDRERRC